MSTTSTSRIHSIRVALISSLLLALLMHFV
jgi:hypothetical protein